MLFRTLGLDPVDIIKKEVLHQPASLKAKDAKPLPQGPVQVAVLVVSEPTGAEIFIDGSSTGVITPATVQVEEKRPVTIEGRREGFAPGKTRVESPENGAKVLVELQKANVGFLDINIFGAEATLFINDEEVSARPPVRKLPVEAGRPLRVQARNRSTGAVDEAEIIVGANQSQSLTLYPKVPSIKKAPASYKK